MFEKEAKERAKDYTDNAKRQVAYECGFLDGVDLGYNKANEWHFVKDGLPLVKKEYNGRSELVLVLSKEKEMQYAQYVEKEKTWARGICEINFEPYAWKEIVLPELPKESE